MTMRKSTLALALLLSSSSLAWSAATAEQAATIKQSLQAYFTAEPGVVDVAPAGDDYAVTLDPAPLFKKIPADSAQFSMSPTKLLVRPNGDGTWSVSSSGPFDFTMSAKDLVKSEVHAKDMSWTGTFSEAIGGFTASNGTATEIKFTQEQTDPRSQIKSSSATAVAKLETKFTATDKGNGSVDTDASCTLSGLTNATTMAPTADAPPGGFSGFNYAINMEGGTYTSSAKGLRGLAVRDLLAWFVAHPSKEAIIADQATLKAKLTDALPIMESVNGTFAGGKTTVTTAMGNFELASSAMTAEFGGLVKEGRLSEGFSVSGLKIPAGLLPPLFQDMVPTDSGMTFTVSGFDADAGARHFLKEVDFAKDPPMSEEASKQFAALALPTNTITLGLPKFSVKSSIYALDVDGTAIVNLAGPPTGKATIRLAGLDAIIAKAQEAAKSDPSIQQQIAMLMAAKGLAKTDADGTATWVVDVTPEGKTLVNGMDISAMGGGMTP